MKRPKTLTAAFVRTIRQPGIYGDGRGSRGLALRVYRMDNGRVSKRWRQRVRIGGRLTTIALGQWPELSLQGARRQAIENSRTATKGIDPRGDGIPTFAEAAERVIKLHAKGWKHPERMTVQWRQSLRDYVLPTIGGKSVGKVTTADVMAVLTPIWSTKTATARIVRQRIGTVLKWAVAQGYREDNPAGDAITAALPKHNGRTRHHAALPFAQVGDAIRTIQASRADAVTVAAVEFLILTAARVSEVTQARAAEVDLAGRVWTVPAERSKTGRPHRVPLSDRSIELLAGRLDGDGLIFPTRSGVAMSRHLPGKLLKRLGIAGTPHGMRSAFRNWAGEGGVAREVAEACLAHAAGQNPVEAAYLTTSFFDRRRTVMEAWAAYIDRRQSPD